MIVSSCSTVPFSQGIVSEQLIWQFVGGLFKLKSNGYEISCVILRHCKQWILMFSME